MKSQVVAALRDSRIFEGLSDGDLSRVAAVTTELRLPSGSVACRQGEKASQVTILASGRLWATASEKGSERTVCIFEPGESFGEIALFESGNYVITVTAVEDCRLLTIPAEPFFELISAIPQVGRNLIRSLAGRLKQAVQATGSGKRARTIGVVHFGTRGRTLLRLLSDELAARGERVCIADGFDRPGSAVSVAGGPAGSPPSDRDRLILEFAFDLPGAGFSPRFAECDRVLWFVEPAEEGRPREALLRLMHDIPGFAPRVRIVWVLRESDQVAPDCHPAWKAGHRHFTVELADPPEPATRRQKQGVARLVRSLQGMTLGLVLGGGGARGMAHLGVLRALERAGIDFDIMAGTSAGALVGITYAAGYSADFGVEAFTRELTTPGWLRRLPAGRNWNLLARFRMRAWEPMLRRYFFDWTLERLPVPFQSVTVDLVSAAEVVRDAGDAAHAIMESINLPVISRPICRRGMTLVDGAVLNNLPADVLSRSGADFIVAVGVSSRLRPEFAGNTPQTPTEAMREPGFMETLFRVLETQSHNIGLSHTRCVNLLIEPDTSAFDFADFSRAAELADVGEAAAERVIPRLRQLLAERAAMGRTA